MIPLTQLEALAAANLDGARGRVGRQRDRQPRSPPLDVEELQVVQPPLVPTAVLRIVQLLEDGHRQAAACAHPHREGERIGAIERASLAEADLRVAVECRRPAHLADVEGGITGHRATVLKTAGDIRKAPVELVVRGETPAIDVLRTGSGPLRQRIGHRRLPLALDRLDDLVGERGLVCLDGRVEVVEHLLLCGRRQQQHRHGIPALAVEAELRHVIEEREELVELLVADGIELVRVAARTPHRQPHERRRRRFHTVDDVFDLVLVGDRTAFEIDHVVAVEPRGHFLIAGRVWKQVPRQLLDRELVVREIAVERADDPVAPGPHAAQAVDVVAVRVGVARRIEPGHGHALAVARRLEQGVDALLVGIRRAIGKKCVDLGRRRR